MNNKERPIKSFYICNGCTKPIINPIDGLVFKGNVYVADAEATTKVIAAKGLVGNNFPQLNKEGSFTINDVGETAHHLDRFLKYLVQEGYAEHRQQGL